MQAQKTIGLLKDSEGSPRGVVIDRVTYDVRDTESHSIRVPEEVISEIELANVPQEVTFEIELSLGHSVPSSAIVEVTAVDSQQAHIAINFIFERQESGIDVDKLGRAISRFMLTRNSIGLVSFESDELVIVEAVSHVAGKTFEEILMPIRETLTDLMNKLDELKSAIESDFWQV